MLDCEPDAVNDGEAALLCAFEGAGDGAGAGLVVLGDTVGVGLGLGVAVGAGLPLGAGEGETVAVLGLGEAVTVGAGPTMAAAAVGPGANGPVPGRSCGNAASTASMSGAGRMASTVPLLRGGFAPPPGPVSGSLPGPASGPPPGRGSAAPTCGAAACRSRSPITSARPSDGRLAVGLSRRRLRPVSGSPGVQAKASEPPTIQQHPQHEAAEIRGNKRREGGEH